MQPANMSELIERELDVLVALRRSKDKEFINGRVKEWLRWRERRFGLREVDTTHTCNLDCREHIRKLDSDLPLYGCDLSGRHHYCRKSSATCNACYVDDNCSYFCVYTGFCVGIQEATYRYFNKDKLTKGLRDAEYSSMAGGGEDGDDDQLSQALLARQRVVEDKPVLFAAERKKGRKRKRKGRPAYNTTNAGRRKPKGINLVREAGRVLDRILWSTGPRNKLYKKSHEKAKKRYGALLKDYVMRCARSNERISLPVMDRIVDTEMQSVGPRPLVKDLNLHNLYCKWIVLMWNLTQTVDSPKRTRFPVRFEQHAIGMLYRLRRADITKEDDESHEKVIIIKREPWLEENLPDQKDLTHFGQKNGKDIFTKNDITKGIKHLVIALLYCQKNPSELLNIFWNGASI